MALLMYSTFLIFSAYIFALSQANNFITDFDFTFGGWREKILDKGHVLSLSLDEGSGSGLRSRVRYLYNKIDMDIKLVRGNSAGTIATFYLSSPEDNHDEIDFEFLGDVTSSLYTLQTNIYINGIGNREQRFVLWFDPTQDYHKYTILWNPYNIIFFVDETPIRQFRNLELQGVLYPTRQPMWLYLTLWHGDWASRVKIDWSLAPFTATYAFPCIWTSLPSSCSGSHPVDSWKTETLDRVGKERLLLKRRKYMTYDYCTDTHRFPQGLPQECHISM